MDLSFSISSGLATKKAKGSNILSHGTVYRYTQLYFLYITSIHPVSQLILMITVSSSSTYLSNVYCFVSISLSSLYCLNSTVQLRFTWFLSVFLKCYAQLLQTIRGFRSRNFWASMINTHKHTTTSVQVYYGVPLGIPRVYFTVEMFSVDLWFGEMFAFNL